MKRTLNVDFYDLVNTGGDAGTPDFYDERRIDNLLRRVADEGIHRVLWRLSVVGKEAYYTKVRTPFDMAEPREINQRMADVMARFDPLAVACDLAHRYGLQIYPWITLYDEYYSNGLGSDFVRQHPEYQFVAQDQKRAFRGTLCYNYPEVRTHRLEQMREVLAYDIDGFYLCTRSHAGECEEIRTPEFFGFNRPVVQAYAERYGVDILSEPFDPLPWYLILGEGLTQFLREVKTTVRQSKDVPVAVGIMRRPLAVRHVYPMCKLEVDWHTWVREGLVDELVVFAGEDLLGPDREDMPGTFDIDPRWVDEAPETYRLARESGTSLTVWFRLFDWMNRYPPPHVPGAPRTKPAPLIEKMMKKIARLGFDDVALHEAMNVEMLDLWSAVREPGER